MINIKELKLKMKMKNKIKKAKKRNCEILGNQMYYSMEHIKTADLNEYAIYKLEKRIKKLKKKYSKTNDPVSIKVIRLKGWA